MFKITLKSIVLASIMLTTSVIAAEVKLTDPNKMVQKVADNTFERITKDQPLIIQNQEHLRVIVEEELMPYIDFRYAALRVLGSEVSKIRAITDKAEKDRAIKDIQHFIVAFREYLVATYAGVFTQYTNQQVEFAAEQPFKGKDIIMVKTKIIESGKPDIRIDFKVRQDRGGDWRAFDMVAEGISLLDAKQSELQGILRQRGIAHVSELLEQKSQLPVQFRGSEISE